MGDGTPVEPEQVTGEILFAFLQRIGESWTSSASVYLLGGSALGLLGNPRETRDLDYTVDLPADLLDDFRRAAAAVASDMRLDLEEVPIGEFVPLPPDAYERKRFVGRFGQVDVFIFDLYSIALSKIARGFESDLYDVMFMLRVGLVEFSELQRYFQLVVPQAAKFDIDPREFRQYFEEIQRRLPAG